MKILPISIVIPTMNRPEALERTLSSIISWESIPAEIIVVDQSSSLEINKENKKNVDRIGSLCKTLYFHLDIPSSTVSRNLGFKHASQNIVLFSDDDVDIFCNTLQVLYNDMENNKTAMVAGVNKKYSNSNGLLGYFTGRKSWINRNRGYVTKAIYSRYPAKQFSGIVSTQWAAGFYFSIKKNLAEEGNVFFDEKLTGYAYAEDLDYTYSYYKFVKKKGLNCIIDSEVVVDHLVSNEYREIGRNTILRQMVNRRYLSYKHFSWDSRMACIWSDFAAYIQMCLKGNKKTANMIKDAIKICWKHRKQIKNGHELWNLYSL